MLMLCANVARAQPLGPRPVRGNPPPQFPTAAIADAVIGFVDVKVTVKPDGKPGRVQVVKVAPEGFGFEKAARDAVARWRFEPPTGAGAASTFTTRFDFRPVPVPITSWQPARGASISFPESGRTLQLKRGWVRTPRWFSDFVLDVEFRLLEERTVAGVLIHAQPLGQDGDRMAYRVNVTNDANRAGKMGRIDGGPLTFREVSFDQSAATAAMRPVGEWQTVRVESTNGATRVIANGVPISLSDQFTRRAGHIGFEVTAGAVEVRAAKVERRDTFYEARTTPGPSDGSPEITIPRSGSPGITDPLLVAEVKPDYSIEAMRAVKQGLVVLDATVLADGSVDQVTVTRSLDLDLDQSAVAAVRRWRFEPGHKDGQRLAVRVVVEMSFSLR